MRVTDKYGLKFIHFIKKTFENYWIKNVPKLIFILSLYFVCFLIIIIYFLLFIVIKDNRFINVKRVPTIRFKKVYKTNWSY